MKYILIVLVALILLVSCRSSNMKGMNYGSPKMKQELYDDESFIIRVYSQDESYGYSERNPILVGGNSEGPKNERRFLNALVGPNGESVQYRRTGSCCPFATKNSEWGGMLDTYEVSYEGLGESVVLYINMYDSDTLKVPVGFKLKHN